MVTRIIGCAIAVHEAFGLFNFNSTSLRNGGVRRVTHPDIYGKTKIFRE
jgi:hypothetical protein